MTMLNLKAEKLLGFGCDIGISNLYVAIGPSCFCSPRTMYLGSQT